VCKDFLHTTQHGAIQGKTQENAVKYYDLDAILSVGYCANSKSVNGLKRLKEYIVKGFIVNQKRLDELE